VRDATAGVDEEGKPPSPELEMIQSTESACGKGKREREMEIRSQR
jgi:hypothetical protein